MTGLECAICHHVRFVAVESELDVEREIRPAVTLIGGTAVCALHIEDYDRAHANWLLKIAAGILGVRLRRQAWGER